jgi:hypothetical protein
MGDVKSEIHALDSDLRTHMSFDNTRQPVMTSLPEPVASISDLPPSDPQMEGLPPKGIASEPVTEAAPAPVVKPRKPRSPKAEPAATDIPADESPVVAKPARRKSTPGGKATS